MWHATEVPAPHPNPKEAAALKRNGLNEEQPDMRKAIKASLAEAAMPALAEPGNPQRLPELVKLLAQWKSTHALESILVTAIAAQPDHAARFLESVPSNGNPTARRACVGACGELMAPPVAPLRMRVKLRGRGSRNRQL